MQPQVYIYIYIKLHTIDTITKLYKNGYANYIGKMTTLLVTVKVKCFPIVVS